jgi:hypothetical protein
MRRLVFTILTAATLTTSSVALADLTIGDSSPRRNAFLINPGDLLNGVLSLEYERGVAPWLGINFGLGLTFFDSIFNDDDRGNTGLTAEVGFRFHFIRHAPGGLWFGPYITGSTMFDPDRYQWWTWGLGAAVGYNFVLGRHFTLQLGGGGGFVDYGDHLSWDPRFRVAVGASW